MGLSFLPVLLLPPDQKLPALTLSPVWVARPSSSGPVKSVIQVCQKCETPFLFRPCQNLSALAGLLAHVWTQAHSEFKSRWDHCRQLSTTLSKAPALTTLLAPCSTNAGAPGLQIPAGSLSTAGGAVLTAPQRSHGSVQLAGPQRSLGSVQLAGPRDGGSGGVTAPQVCWT